jgi:hypothetical protein
MVVVVSGFVVISHIFYMIPYILVFWHCDQALNAVNDWQRVSDLLFYIVLPMYICQLIVYSLQRKMCVEGDVVFKANGTGRGRAVRASTSVPITGTFTTSTVGMAICVDIWSA